MSQAAALELIEDYQARAERASQAHGVTVLSPGTQQEFFHALDEEVTTALVTEWKQRADRASTAHGVTVISPGTQREVFALLHADVTENGA